MARVLAEPPGETPRRIASGDIVASDEPARSLMEYLGNGCDHREPYTAVRGSAERRLSRWAALLDPLTPFPAWAFPTGFFQESLGTEREPVCIRY
jgi:hypothetical protein